MSTLKEALEKVKSELPSQVTLVAVSKTKPLHMIQEAYDAGQRIFGENRPQEMAEKAEQLPLDIQWHMIGHLQTNKVKYILPYVSLIHSMDSLGLMDEVQKRAKKLEKKIDVLLQVHIAQEDQKHGFDAEDLMNMVNKKVFNSYNHLCIKGLMGMATFTEDQAQIRKEFRSLKKLFDEMRPLMHENFDTLSMGMSGDMQIAIEEGSTMVRIGSSIFGNR